MSQDTLVRLQCSECKRFNYDKGSYETRNNRTMSRVSGEPVDEYLYGFLHKLERNSLDFNSIPKYINLLDIEVNDLDIHIRELEET